MDSVLLDIRFALRSLRGRPVFAAVAIATIALSIGAATAIFSVVDGVLFRSLPYHDAGKLVAIWQTDSTRKKSPVLAASWDRFGLDYTDYLHWRAKQTSFSSIGVSSGFGAMRTDGNEAEPVVGSRVSPGYFDVLGIHPMLGRAFVVGEDAPGGPRVTMISAELWRSRFGARTDVVGSSLTFDGEPYEIIGVLPDGFTIERGKPGAPFWIPAGQSSGDIGKHNRSFRAIGRLKPGVTVEQASLETQQLLDASYGVPTPIHGVRITDLVRDETRTVRAPMLLLLGAVGVLLLIACANIATLLLGEAAARDVEMSTRSALGASRARVARQLLTESVLLATIGSAAGVVLAWWGTKAIVALAPGRIPGIAAARVDGRVLLVTLAVSALTGVLFGLAPALTLSSSGPAALMRSVTSVRGGGKLQRILISVELALSMVLLVGAGLLSRSLQKLSSVEPGFRADHLLSVSIAARGNYGDDQARLTNYYAEALPRMRGLPGVVDVTTTSTVPMSGGSSSSPYLLPGEPESDRGARKHEVQQATVDANYFAMMGISIVAGRAFTNDDRASSELVAIINESAARRDFPTESAVGNRVNYQGGWRTIVGVVRNVKVTRLAAADVPGIYTPFAQRTGELPDFIIRTRTDAATLTELIRAMLRDVDPTFVPVKFETMDDMLTRSFAEERFRTALIVLFGAIAAVLAAVGLFGVTARAVSRRTREVGIRVALGAETRAVVAMIMKQTVRGVALGVIFGAAVAFVASSALTPYLFGVSSHDPATYAAISAFLGLITILSSWLPARRAGKIEPAIVLRGE
ncbi:MAG TPA: ABC transporter permease [Gemmatimonadaceae bacterium]|jgi:predicted permease